MLNVKMIFEAAGGTIIGDVSEDISNGNITVHNPAYLVPQQEGLQLIPALQAMGVDESEDTMIFTKSEVKYGKMYQPLPAVVDEYKKQFGHVSLELPDDKLILK